MTDCKKRCTRVRGGSCLWKNGPCPIFRAVNDMALGFDIKSLWHASSRIKHIFMTSSCKKKRCCLLSASLRTSLSSWPLTRATSNSTMHYHRLKLNWKKWFYESSYWVFCDFKWDGVFLIFLAAGHFVQWHSCWLTCWEIAESDPLEV